MKLPKISYGAWFFIVIIAWLVVASIYIIENEAVRGMFG
ncbi:putative membrane protein [Yersinia aldovae 670-83]|nr:putative membrane protein [Yersinia aldovae 670-83]